MLSCTAAYFHLFCLIFYFSLLCKMYQEAIENAEFHKSSTEQVNKQ